MVSLFYKRAIREQVHFGFIFHILVNISCASLNSAHAHVFDDQIVINSVMGALTANP